MVYLFAVLTLFGHWAISIFIINRLHSTALPYRLMKAIDLIWYSSLFVWPPIVAMAVWGVPQLSWLATHPMWRSLGTLYFSACCIAFPMAVFTWVQHYFDTHTTSRLEGNHSRTIDVIGRLGHRPTGNWSTTLLSSLPRNQVFNLWVQEKSIRLPRLHPELDGLTIGHLSDLHFTGRTTRPYYELVVDEANELDADLLVISGDIIDKRPCFPWLTEILGRLRSRHGVFFVLGNHDLRVRDELRVRNDLTAAGLTDLGGRFQQIEVRGQQIVLAGNELPWFAPAADMKHAPRRLANGSPLRIAVSHSPDQIEWARSYDIDLMLAGHTHGGQIRFPIIGPVFSPSRYGVRFASGTFYRDPTLMHVSRGLSGTRALRFNCPPELTKLVLRSDANL
ncbi:MAG: metallophosphoesterase [Planctomycetales bacterium]|nr:metallophosphoesterase [Planctomycetales bacterium]